MSYTFIDLFAGIGGFHLGLERAGMSCVFASELDESARQTYMKNHDIDPDIFNDDIRKISPREIPDHDILCAGFPCQPFSQAGHKKGFNDGSNSERGNLFFCIADILEAKRPKAFILENVRHLLKHDDGNTFKVIKDTLEEIGYAVHFKIIKATDFGKPQHRPRIYIIGFDREQINNADGYSFPAPIPLKETMSDIWQGKCERAVGFTLRVGGRGSSINDRRNWDSYRVDGEVRQLGPIEGKRMMGFPENFILPKTITHSMKQLGNSVCVDVINHLALSVKGHLDGDFDGVTTNLNVVDYEKIKMNKGEWSELYAFLLLLLKNKLHFGDVDGGVTDEYVTVLEVAHNRSDLVYSILQSNIVFSDQDGRELKTVATSEVVSDSDISMFLDRIKNGKGRSFSIPEMAPTLNNASVKSCVKGASFEKGDLRIGFNYQQFKHALMPLGIKSDLGSKATLLNASSATNFIYKVEGFTGDIDSINAIDSRSKIKDRLKAIYDAGGSISFLQCEKQTHEKNLLMVDSMMPSIIADVLLRYYNGEGSKVRQLIQSEQPKMRFKEYLKSVMLGMFCSEAWNGDHESKGSILVKKDGDLALFHILQEKQLKDYLFNNTKLDTPSSTRHRFGNLYREGNEIYIKLNLQIRML